MARQAEIHSYKTPTMQFIKIGIIDLNLPPAVGSGQGSTMNMPKETGKKLDLAITITDRGFYISSSLAILRAGNKYGLGLLVS